MTEEKKVILVCSRCVFGGFHNGVAGTKSCVCDRSQDIKPVIAFHAVPCHFHYNEWAYIGIATFFGSPSYKLGL